NGALGAGISRQLRSGAAVAAARPARTGGEMNSSWQRVLAVMTIALVGAGLLPVLAALMASFTPESRIFGAPALDLRDLTLEHYRALFETRDFWVPIRNSVVVAGVRQPPAGGACGGGGRGHPAGELSWGGRRSLHR